MSPHRNVASKFIFDRLCWTTTNVDIMIQEKKTVFFFMNSRGNIEWLTDSMDSTEARICRLCFSSQLHLIDIFRAADSNVLEIIAEHIGEVSTHTHTHSVMF